jgi:hypothetical protein
MVGWLVSLYGMLASTHRAPKRTFSMHNATFVVRQRILRGDGARESGSLPMSQEEPIGVSLVQYR